MNITFTELSASHFPLLLKWLQSAHIKEWWDQDIDWTLDLITQKYSSYINNPKLNAYIINVDKHPVGYIQSYDAYAFPRNTELIGLPESLAAIDIFIGESNYINKNIATTAMQLFCNQFIAAKYEYTFVDPDINNLPAIKAYAKAGFMPIKPNPDSNELWMIRQNKPENKNA